MGAWLNQLILSISGLMVMATNTAQAAQDQREIQQLLQEMMNSTPQTEAVQSVEPDSRVDQTLREYGVKPENFSWRKQQTPPLSQNTPVKSQEVLSNVENNLSGDLERKTPAERLGEIPSPLETFSGGLEDGAEILTGGKQAESGEKAKKEAEAQVDSHYWTSQGNDKDPFDGTYTLKKNNRYQSGKGTYETDENGAIRSWSADLRGVSEPGQRSYSHQHNLPGKYEGDHAGHLLSAQEGGSGKVDNLVPMNGKVNTRDYRAFERENHQLLQEGYRVQLEGSNFLSSSKNRPEAFMVTRSVYDNEGNLLGKDHFSWTNEDMSQFQDNDFGYDDIPNPMDQQLEAHGITREEIEQMEQEATSDSRAKSKSANTQEADLGKQQGTDQTEDVSQVPKFTEEENQDNTQEAANTQETDPEKQQGTNQDEDVSQVPKSTEEENQDNTKGVTNTQETDLEKQQVTNQNEDVSQVPKSTEEENQDNTKGAANTQETDPEKQQENNSHESPWLKNKDGEETKDKENARDDLNEQKENGINQDQSRESPWLKKEENKEATKDGPDGGGANRDQDQENNQAEPSSKEEGKDQDGWSGGGGQNHDGPEEDINR